MSPGKLREAIETTYAKLERTADRNGEASSLLVKAYTAANDGEKAHRRMLGGTYSIGIDHAARYFVIKWVFAEGLGVHRPTWRGAAATRLDALYAYALRETLGSELPAAPEWLAEVDYSRDIACHA